MAVVIQFLIGGFQTRERKKTGGGHIKINNEH